MAIYAFGPFQLDPACRVLTRNGAPVPLNARAFEVLYQLAKREGGVVGRDEILTEVWRGVTVEENNLTVQISALRRALGDLPGGAPAIVTVPNRGYQLALPVTRAPAPSATPAASTGSHKRGRTPRLWWLAASQASLG